MESSSWLKKQKQNTPFYCESLLQRIQLTSNFSNGEFAPKDLNPLPTGDGYIKGAIVSLSLDMEQMFHNHMALGRELIQP